MLKVELRSFDVTVMCAYLDSANVRIHAIYSISYYKAYIQNLYIALGILCRLKELQGSAVT